MQHDGRAPRWYRGGFGSIPNVGSGGRERTCFGGVSSDGHCFAGISLGEKSAFQAVSAEFESRCPLQRSSSDVSTGGSGGRFTKPACEGSTPSRDATALARGPSAAFPKRGYAVRLSTRAPQGSGNGVPVGLMTRCHERARFDSEPCNGDNARRDAGLISLSTVVRVHLSPLRDRLLARIARL